MVGRYRATLGKNFNEGARQLWLAVERGDWTVASIAAAAETTTAVIYRYMYGDRRPDRTLAARLRSALGIEPLLWDSPVTEPFSPPTEAFAMQASKPDPASSSSLPASDDADATGTEG